MATPPTNANELRQTLHRVLRRARPHGRAVGQPDPARPDRAVHRGRHGAVQALLHRRRGAAVQAGHGRAEVRAGRWQAQRPRRRRSHPPPHRVLRDDGQLQLRGLLQGEGHPLGVGAASPSTLGFDGDRIWITVHTSDDEAEQIWHDVVGVPMARIQRLGDADNFWQMGDTGPVRAVLRAPHRPGPDVRARGWPAGRPGRRALHGVLEPGLHAVRPGRRRHPHAPAPPVHRHRRRPRAHAARCSRASTRSGTPTCCGRSSRSRRSLTGRRLRRATSAPT